MTGFEFDAKGFFQRGDWAKALLPLLILSLYHFLLFWFLTRLMPEEDGFVTAEYALEAGVVFLGAAAGLYLASLIHHRVTGGRRPGFDWPSAGPRPGDIVLVLVPLTPVVRYVLNNQDILSVQGSLIVLAVFFVFALVTVIIVPGLLGTVTSVGSMMLAGLAFSFTITNMATLSAASHWFREGEILFVLALLFSVYLAAWLVRRLGGGNFLRAVAVLFFLANTAAEFVGREPRPEPEPKKERFSTLGHLVGDRQPVSLPDIYLLVYDAYVANETMSGYGIDNSHQERYLEDLGFSLYPETYSLAGATISSMSRVLNAANSYYDNKRLGVSGNGIVHNLLKGFGYVNEGVFYNDYFFRGIEPSYDAAYPGLKATHLLVVKAVLMGEFRFDVEIDNPPYEKFARHKAKVLRVGSTSPRFVYVHDELPGHSQNSGRCLPEEAELFQGRLARANAAMKEDIATILERDPEAIVIIAGDHGPYLTKNCDGTGGHFDISEISRLNIQDRLGTFLAVRWPGGRPNPYDDIALLQDIFPAVFALMFQDETLLQAKVKAKTASAGAVSGAAVLGGIIQGGLHDGEPLFLNGR